MEKFNAWRDNGTGISPFMPPVAPKSSFFADVLASFRLIIKLPFLAILYLAVYVVPKPAVKLALYGFMGIGDIDLLVEGVRKTKLAEIEKNKPNKNDIVVVNLISPIDVFIVFVVSQVNSLTQIRVVIPTPRGLHVLSAWQYVSFMFRDLNENLPNDTKLVSYKELEGKLVLLFPEGTSTNNKAILPFEKVPSDFFLIPGFTYKNLVLRMYSNFLTLPVPYITQLQYFKRLVSRSEKTFIKIKVAPSEKCLLNESKAVFAENGLNTVGLGLNDKKQFYKYYKDRAVSAHAK